jgi:hypothetical protein
MRLRGDHSKRAVFAGGIGLGITGPFAAILLAAAPPDEVVNPTPGSELSRKTTPKRGANRSLRRIPDDPRVGEAFRQPSDVGRRK